MMGSPVALYIALAVVLVASICIDFFGHKDGNEMSFKESTLWSLFWIAIGISFGGFIYWDYGSVAASEYFAGYAMEKALSIDNLMVFMAIFTYFGIKTSSLQHKILLWGIAGALVFRGIFVGVGTALFNLHWSIQCLFAAAVIFSAKPMLFPKGEDEDEDFDKKWFVKAAKKLYPVDTRSGITSFFTRINGKRHITAIMLCLVTIEFSDIIFSFDSVPAVIGVTKETPLIYAAMILAVLGLRALFFVLHSLTKHLTRLETFVGIILVFIGVKMIIASAGYHFDPIASLCVVLGLLAAGVITSLVAPKNED